LEIKQYNQVKVNNKLLFLFKTKVREKKQNIQSEFFLWSIPDIIFTTTTSVHLVVSSGH